MLNAASFCVTKELDVKKSEFTVLPLALHPELHALTCRALDRRVRW